jgi:hypothetical protein
MKIKIDKGVPIPDIGGMYPFKEMEIGDSFFVECLAKNVTRKANSILGSARNRRTNGRYKVRTVEGGVRCWRVG